MTTNLKDKSTQFLEGYHAAMSDVVDEADALCKMYVEESKNSSLFGLIYRPKKFVLLGKTEAILELSQFVFNRGSEAFALKKKWFDIL